MSERFSALFLVLGVTGFFGCASTPQAFLETRFPSAKTRSIRPGVSYAVWTTTVPVVVHVLAIDLAQKGISFRPVLGRDVVSEGPENKEPILSMARRTGALAMINADYGSKAGSNVEGLSVIDGKILFAPDPPGRSSVVIGKDHRVWIGRYSPQRNPELDYAQAVGGGPKIIEKGVFRWEVDDQGGINDEDFKVPEGRWNKRHSMTALCLDQRRFMFWVVVHGEKPAPYFGMTPWELAQVLEKLGCWEAIRLDGGGSSAMVLQGRLVSTPFEGFPEGRPNGSSLGLFEP
ncbi:MAG: phosphodiester glycosidase family protein [Elusimicrobiota bacterium]